METDLSFFGLKGKADYDHFSGNLYYRSGDLGYTVGNWDSMGFTERENALAYLVRLEDQQKKLYGTPTIQFQATVNDVNYALGDMLGANTYAVNDMRDMTNRTHNQNLYEKAPLEVSPNRTLLAPYDIPKVVEKDIRDMTMKEFSDYRRSMGVSTNSGSGEMFSLDPVKVLSKFEKWQDAREKFINGQGSIEDVLKYVESDEDGYSRLVDEEIAEERKRDVAVPKHGINWRRWPLWRWIASRFHRRDLGRNRVWQIDSGTALRERPGAAQGSSMDLYRF